MATATTTTIKQVAPIDAVIALVVNATRVGYDEEAVAIIEAWQSEVGHSANVNEDAIIRLTIALWKLTDIVLPTIPVRDFATFLAAAYRGI